MLKSFVKLAVVILIIPAVLIPVWVWIGLAPVDQFLSQQSPFGEMYGNVDVVAWVILVAFALLALLLAATTRDQLTRTIWYAVAALNALTIAIHFVAELAGVLFDPVMVLETLVFALNVILFVIFTISAGSTGAQGRLPAR